MPTKEFAIESINWPLTPKSHSFISPREFTKIFDGFTSVEHKHRDGLKATASLYYTKNPRKRQYLLQPWYLRTQTAH